MTLVGLAHDHEGRLDSESTVELIGIDVQNAALEVVVLNAGLLAQNSQFIPAVKP